MTKRFEGMPATWRLLQTKPSAEMRVVEGLSQYGLVGYVPKETVWRRARNDGVKTEHSRPLIRGYVFVALPAEALHVLHDLDGAGRLVSFNGKLATVPFTFIKEMRERETSGEFDLTLSEKARKARGIRQGDRVRVSRGQFAGFIGAVQRLSGSRRVVVMLALFGSVGPAEMELESIELLEPAETVAA